MAKEATKHEAPVKTVFVKGFGWIQDIPLTFEQKLQIIRNKEEAGRELVEEVIKDAHTQDALKSVAMYLQGYPSDYLNLNTKTELLRQCMNKLIKISKEDETIKEWMVKHSMMLIEGLVDYL